MNLPLSIREDDDPRLSDLYPGWTKVDCTRAKHMSHTNGEKKTAPEVLLLNGESYTCPKVRSLFA